MIFVAARMWFPWHKHKTWVVLVKPKDHTFIKTIHLDEMILVMLVEPDIVECILKCRRLFVSECCGGTDIYKATFLHVFVELEGSTMPGEVGFMDHQSSWFSIPSKHDMKN